MADESLNAIIEKVVGETVPQSVRQRVSAVQMHLASAASGDPVEHFPGADLHRNCPRTAVLRRKAVPAGGACVACQLLLRWNTVCQRQILP